MYTQEDINNSNGKLVAIGATDPLYVVGEFNDEGTVMTLKKNHANSDGLVADYSMDLGPALSNSTIQSIVIEEGVSNVGNCMFFGCSNLSIAIIKEGVTVIDNMSFGECTSLSSVEIPSTVEEIEVCAFYNCTSITSIIYNGTQSEWNSIIFGTDWIPDIAGYTVYCTDGNIVN